MKVPIAEAAGLVCAMGGVIFFCRVFPFLFFSGEKLSQSKGTRAFLDFVERIVPPAVMTVLTFNALGPSLGNLAKNLVSAVQSSPLSGEFSGSLAVIVAAILTALIHLWKRNALISIFGGTALYMVLQRIVIYL